MNPASQSLLSRIAEWNLNLSFEDIPDTVVDKARSQIQSVLAAVYAGRVLAESASVVRAARVLHKGTEATVLTSGEKLSVEGAVLANASMSMAHDFDDYLFMGHTGHSAVLASLALCEAHGKRVADLVACQVAANELAGRLGASAVLGPLNGQMWSFIHLIAGASVAGRVLGLQPEQMEHAVAIALSQPPYPSFDGFFCSGTKLLTASWPTVLGIQAAYFAAQGMTGPRRVLEGERGFYRTFSFHPIQGAWDGLGRQWLTESLAVKQYPGCAYVDSALDALEWILGRVRQERGEPLRPSDILRIQVSATVLTCEMERLGQDFGRAEDPVSMNFSVRRSLAWRIIQGTLDAEAITEQRVRESKEAVQALAERIFLAADMSWNRGLLVSLAERAGLLDIARELGLSGLLALLRKASSRYGLREHLPSAGAFFERLRGALRFGGGGPAELRLLGAALRRLGARARNPRFSLSRIDPAALEFPFASTVEMFLSDGSVLRREQRVPVGAPGNHDRPQRDVAREKFLMAASGLLGHGRADLALRMLETLDPDQRIEALVTCLAAEPARSGRRSPRRRAHGAGLGSARDQGR